MRALRLLRAAAGLILLIAVVPGAAHAGQTDEQRALLVEAGVDLPEQIANFRRVGIGSTSPGRVDGRYAGPAGAMVDIFIARSDDAPAVELAYTESMIAAVFGRLTRVRDLVPPPTASGAVGRLWRGESGRGPVLTGMMLHRRGGWRIKIRGTLPETAGEAGWAEVERLMREFDWGAAEPDDRAEETA